MSKLTQPIETSAPLASPWQPDLGNGDYQNPILYADYSDPDAIGVGDDYWMVASSFCCVPGLPILHSKDLVNWEIVNHALPKLIPDKHYCCHRAGCGVWAPTIRYHQQRYWIFYPDPDFGIYVTTAEHPTSTWSVPRLLKPGKGIIDPCPFWDEDGRAYLLHAWAKSRSGIKNILTLQEMTPDTTALIGSGKTIIDGNRMQGWHTIEGPKLYKAHGYYWVFAPAGGVGEGYQAVFRAKTLDGPYESRIVLEQGDSPINGPHQGAWVTTPEGEDWFLHFQELFPYGRVVHLQPMRWTSDRWPVMGQCSDNSTCGNPVLHHSKPLGFAPATPRTPETSDTFIKGVFGKQWQWQANFQPDWLAPVEGELRAATRAGTDACSRTKTANGLHLACFPKHSDRNLWTSGNLLLQKLPAPSFTVETELTLHAATPGDRAGLILFGYDYFWIGLQQSGQATQLVVHTCLNADTGAPEHETVLEELRSAKVRLRADFQYPNQLQFSWALDEKPFERFHTVWSTRQSKWVGAKIGLFACSDPTNTPAGSALFTSFQVRHP